MNPVSRALVLDRRIAVFGLVGLATPSFARAKPCAPARVLFVCPAGTVKSAIAREQFKQSAARRGLAVQVQSRGVHPEDHLTPALIAQLRADSVNPRAEPVQALRAADIAHADVVVAFEDAAKAPGMEHARVWDIPSWKTDYAGARAAQQPMIDALVAELRARQEGPCASDRP